MRVCFCDSCFRLTGHGASSHACSSSTDIRLGSQNHGSNNVVLDILETQAWLERCLCKFTSNTLSPFSLWWTSCKSHWAPYLFGRYFLHGHWSTQVRGWSIEKEVFMTSYSRALIRQTAWGSIRENDRDSLSVWAIILLLMYGPQCYSARSCACCKQCFTLSPLPYYDLFKAWPFT